MHNDQDVEIQRVIKSLEDAFNRHDPVAISEHYAEQSAWATVTGKELSGRQEIEAFGRVVMEQLADSYARYKITRILWITDEVAAVRVHQTPVTVEGVVRDAQHGACLYVLAKQNDEWKIYAGQNTFVLS